MKHDKKKLLRLAEEVGLHPEDFITEKTANQMAKMIVDKINPSIGYSKEFVIWYDNLPIEFFGPSSNRKKSKGGN